MKTVKLALLVAAFLSPIPAFATGPCPIFGAIAANSACGSIITINADQTYSITNPGGPYDGSDDTLIGFVNNSNLDINSVTLSANADIFGFDGDGIDANPYNYPKNSIDTTGYGGPNAYFTNYGNDSTHNFDRNGTVDFINAIQSNGGTGYFFAENALGNVTVTVTSTTTSPGTGGGTVTPEPNSLFLLGTGVAATLAAARRRLCPK